MLRAVIVSLAVSVTLGFGASHAIAADSPTTTLPAATLPAATTDSNANVTDTTSLSNFLTDLQNDPSVCIGFNPPPNCGRKPTQAGDRGGPLQYVVFGVMMAGLAVIGTVIVRKIMARDRMIAESLTVRESQSD